MYHLQLGSCLQGGKYRIEKVLGHGGFGITYLAEQPMLGRRVCVKEFFFKDYCERDETTSQVTLGTRSNKDFVEKFRQKFLKEARNIARLEHPHIVRITDVFEENGTAYYVMEYASGGSLSDKLKMEGRMPEDVAMRYIVQLAEALEYVHEQKMNHLDVKPANVMLNAKDEAVLIDFGLSKQYDAETGTQTSTTPVGISEGYAPMEQYRQGGVKEFSPETDIYALGATFYHLLTGKVPPYASDVNEDGVPVEELRSWNVSERSIGVICKAMEPKKKERLASARTFVKLLTAPDGVPQEPVDEGTWVLPGEPEPDKDGESTLVIGGQKKPDAQPKPQAKPQEVKPGKAEQEEAEKKRRRELAEQQKRMLEMKLAQTKKQNEMMLRVLGIGVGAVVAILVLLFLIGTCVSSGEESDYDEDLAADTVVEVYDMMDEAEEDVVWAEESPAYDAPAKYEPVAEVVEEIVEEAPVAQEIVQEAAPAPAVAEVDDNRIYETAETLASYPGGDEALYAWLNSHVRYPSRAQDQGIQGRVMLKFVVEKDGSIGNVEVTRSPDEDLSAEAIRVVKSMPKWKPATLGGKPVRCYFSLPVMFRLQ